MDAQIPSQETSISFVPRSFPAHRSWMPMGYGQLERSLDWLYGEITHEVAKLQGETELEITDKPGCVAKFSGVRALMWRHRINGIVGDGSYLVQFQICEIGKPEQPLVEGTLGISRCA